MVTMEVPRIRRRRSGRRSHARTRLRSAALGCIQPPGLGAPGCGAGRGLQEIAWRVPVDLSLIDTYDRKKLSSIDNGEHGSLTLKVHTLHPQPSILARTVEVLAAIAIILMMISVIGAIVGHNGLGLTSWSFADQRVMSITVERNLALDTADQLVWVDGPNGTVDEATGKAPVEFGGPIQAELYFWGPTAAERAVFVGVQIMGPLLGIAGTWQVLRMARSTQTGDPFTEQNENRLWCLAFIIAVGGSAYLAIREAARIWLVDRSAAVDLVDITIYVDFRPIAFGLVVAALAAVWHVGVGMRADLDGTI